MAEDTTKSLKIKLSLKDLAPKAPSAGDGDNATKENLSPEKTYNLGVKIPPKPIASATQEDNKINIQIPASSPDNKPKINLKKPQLQDIKLKESSDKSDAQLISQQEAQKTSTITPAYARSSIPELPPSAKDSSIDFEEDVKGKTHKIIRSDRTPPKASVIDLNSLKIDLTPEKENEPNNQTTPNTFHPVEFESSADLKTSSTTAKKNISDTIRLKIKPQSESAPNPFSELTKTSNNLEAPPSSFEINSSSTKDKSDFIIPADLTKLAKNNGSEKKKSHLIILISGIVVFILIVYFALITIKNILS